VTCQVDQVTQAVAAEVSAAGTWVSYALILDATPTSKIA